jgi:hypothetical protein
MRAMTVIEDIQVILGRHRPGSAGAAAAEAAVRPPVPVPVLRRDRLAGLIQEYAQVA